MGESGELKTLHEKCDSLSEKVESDYLRVRDLLERIISQMNEKEDEIVAGLGLDRLRQHGNEGLFDALGLSWGSITLENMSIVRGAHEETGNPEFAAAYAKLGHLLSVRCQVIELKADTQLHYATKVNGNDFEIDQA